MADSTKPELDPETEQSLKVLGREEQARAHRVPGVRTVLLVLSGKGMAYDLEALRQKVLLSYPDSTVFFLTPSGKPVGARVPHQVDLVVDFIGPGTRERFLLAKKLRSMARIAVGRNAGLLRRRTYDRVFDEKAEAAKLPADLLDRERWVQHTLLNLAGIAVVPYGETPADLSHSIALSLPPLKDIS
jgi:hypothetical protein